MTLEQDFFVQALAAYIQGKPDIRVPGGWESLDWPQLLQYARTQNLAGIFYVQCRDNLSRIPALQSILEELQAGGKLPGGRHPPPHRKWCVPPGLCRQEMRLGAAHGAYGCRIRGL